MLWQPALVMPLGVACFGMLHVEYASPRHVAPRPRRHGGSSICDQRVPLGHGELTYGRREDGPDAPSWKGELVQLYHCRVGVGCMDAMRPGEDLWKKHQNLLSNNDDAQSITEYGFLVQLDNQVVALCAHCAKSPPQAIVLSCLPTRLFLGQALEGGEYVRQEA